MADLFPNGIEHYLVGGLLVGAGVGLVHLLTGHIAGISSILSAAQLAARIDALPAPLVRAGPRDVARWPVGECGYFGGFGRNFDSETSNADSPTWEGQVQELKDWIHSRMMWIDSQLL